MTYFLGARDILYKIDVFGKSRQDTFLNETLAFADCKQSKQKDNRLLVASFLRAVKLTHHPPHDC